MGTDSTSSFSDVEDGGTARPDRRPLASVGPASGGMSDFLRQAHADGALRVEADLGHGYVRLRSEEAERRQARNDVRHVEDALVEMLRNSRDAGARHVFVATARKGDRRAITVVDDGGGIPRDLWDAVFEARVTGKLETVHTDAWGVHGRGMALFAIRSRCASAKVADSVEGGGTSIRVVADLASLPEKRDQSAFPQFWRDPSGVVVARGPRNLNRTAAEFAFREKERCQVFVGSPTQVAATLLAFGRATTTSGQRAFSDPATAPLLTRLALAGDPEAFARVAAGMGLEMSGRNARRVMDGQVAPLEDCAAKVERALARDAGAKPAGQGQDGPGRAASGASGQGRPGGPSDDGTEAGRLEKALAAQLGQGDGLATGVRISEEDKADLARSVRGGFQELARRYYLSDAEDVKVSVSRGRLVVSMPLVRDERQDG